MSLLLKVHRPAGLASNLLEKQKSRPPDLLNRDLYLAISPMRPARFSFRSPSSELLSSLVWGRPFSGYLFIFTFYSKTHSYPFAHCRYSLISLRICLKYVCMHLWKLRAVILSEYVFSIYTNTVILELFFLTFQSLCISCLIMLLCVDLVHCSNYCIVFHRHLLCLLSYFTWWAARWPWT